MRFVYTPTMIDFIRETFASASLDETVSMFNFVFSENKTRSQIKAAISNHGVTCGRSTGQMNAGKLRVFTHEQKKWIEQSYATLPVIELTAAFNATFGDNKTVNQMRAFVKNHRISSGRTGQFRKGCESWNKGTRFNAGGRSAQTRFKAGHTPANHRPVGSERIDKDGYLMVKIAEPGTWRHKHRVVWEAANGKIPRGFMILFADNNKTNCELSNLMLASRAQNAVINKLGLSFATGEMKSTSMLVADLRLAISSRAKSRGSV